MKFKFNPRISIELVATLVLVILKLKGVIDWSWWAVTFLLWGEVAIMLAGFFFLYVILYLYKKIDKQ